MTTYNNDQDQAPNNDNNEETIIPQMYWDALDDRIKNIKDLEKQFSVVSFRERVNNMTLEQTRFFLLKYFVDVTYKAIEQKEGETDLQTPLILSDQGEMRWTRDSDNSDPYLEVRDSEELPWSRADKYYGLIERPLFVDESQDFAVFQVLLKKGYKVAK